jgi:hypothetical protein
MAGIDNSVPGRKNLQWNAWRERRVSLNTFRALFMAQGGVFRALRPWHAIL